MRGEAGPPYLVDEHAQDVLRHEPHERPQRGVRRQLRHAPASAPTVFFLLPRQGRQVSAAVRRRRPPSGSPPAPPPRTSDQSRYGLKLTVSSRAHTSVRRSIVGSWKPRPVSYMGFPGKQSLPGGRQSGDPIVGAMVAMPAFGGRGWPAQRRGLTAVCAVAARALRDAASSRASSRGVLAARASSPKATWRISTQSHAKSLQPTGCPARSASAAGAWQARWGRTGGGRGVDAAATPAPHTKKKRAREKTGYGIRTRVLVMTAWNGAKAPFSSDNSDGRNCGRQGGIAPSNDGVIIARVAKQAQRLRGMERNAWVVRRCHGHERHRYSGPPPRAACPSHSVSRPVLPMQSISSAWSTQRGDACTAGARIGGLEELVQEIDVQDADDGHRLHRQDTYATHAAAAACRPIVVQLQRTTPHATLVAKAGYVAHARQGA